MKRFSGGYIRINPNFVVNGASTKIDDDTLYGLCAIVKNILFRGCPAKPSDLLTEKLGTPKQYDNYQYYNESKDLIWTKTIKGGTYTPALDFYENILKKNFPSDYSCFLPECSFNDIVDTDVDERFQVDFYNPRNKIIVEIDGSQHKDEIEKKIDEERDKKLLESGIPKKNIIRIPVSDVGNEKYIEKIRKILSDGSYDIKHSIKNAELNYLYAFRFQIAILEALERGIIRIDEAIWKIKLRLAHEVPIKIFNLALSDLNMWFTHLYALLNKSVEFPVSHISKTDSVLEEDYNLCVDIDVSVNYDETIDICEQNTIKIRNDYFLYPIKDKDKVNCQYKNYYKVSVHSLRFTDINKDNNKHYDALRFCLKNIFGFDKFRPNQVEIIISGLNPENGVIGILPTGSGKSVCYQLVSFLTPGITIIVSPLKSLMEDQCSNLYDRHLITSSYFITAEEKGKFGNIAFINKNAKMLYVAPERFFNKEFQNVLRYNFNNISQIVIDEVHCLSEWGHDFRTSYLLLFDILKMFISKTDVLLMGTTATSSYRVSNDIFKEFQKLHKKPVLIRASVIKRKELNFVVKNISSHERIKLIAEIIIDCYNNHQKVVVFTPYRDRQYNEIIQGLEKNKSENSDHMLDTSADIYHFVGGISPGKDKLQNFKNNKVLIVIATKAFGMGIDIPDIRNTVHYCIPSSVESMYQEAGRAGRDGKRANCYFLFCKNERDLNYLNQYPDMDELREYSWKSVELHEQFWLMSSSNLNPEKEAYNINRVYLVLDNANKSEISSSEFPYFDDYNEKYVKDSSKDMNEQRKANEIDKYLYKLYVLGIINLWSKIYSPGEIIYTNIRINRLTKEELKQNLLQYIGIYDTSFEAPKIIEKEEFGDYLKKVAKSLCEWSFNNFFLTRWNSLRTLYDMFYNFNTSEEISNRISNYFTDNKTLYEAVYNPNNVQLWFEALLNCNEYELNDQLARYREEYPNNRAVNFISGIVCLLLNKFGDINGRQSLLKALKELPEEQLQCVIEQLKNLGIIKRDENKYDFYKIIIDHFPVFFGLRLKSHIQKFPVLQERLKLQILHSKLTDLSSVLEKINGKKYFKE